MVWPGERQRLLVEADPAGGMLAAAAGLRPEPGLVSLAAAARRHDEPVVAFEHCQALPDGIPVLCGPPGPERARSALAMLSGLLGRLGELDAEVFVDCGRFEPSVSNVDRSVRAGRSRRACCSTEASLTCTPSERGSCKATRAAVAVSALVCSSAPAPTRLPRCPTRSVSTWPGRSHGIPMQRRRWRLPSVGARQLTRSPLVRALRTLADDLACRVGSPTKEESQPSGDAVAANGHSSALEVGR